MLTSHITALCQRLLKYAQVPQHHLRSREVLEGRHVYVRIVYLVQRRQQAVRLHAVNERVLVSLPGEILLRYLGEHEIEEALGVILVLRALQYAAARYEDDAAGTAVCDVVVARAEFLALFRKEAVKVVVVYEPYINFPRCLRQLQLACSSDIL